MLRLLPLLLFALSACADPIFPALDPGPLFLPQRGIVIIDLGNGLFWQGIQSSQEEWDLLMSYLPTLAPFVPIDGPLGAPDDGPILDPQQLPMLRLVPEVPTPEPSTLSMLSLGFLAAALLRPHRAFQ